MPCTIAPIVKWYNASMVRMYCKFDSFWEHQEYWGMIWAGPGTALKADGLGNGLEFDSTLPLPNWTRQTRMVRAVVWKTTHWLVLVRDRYPTCPPYTVHTMILLNIINICDVQQRRL
jgi:hypothetical protein